MHPALLNQDIFLQILGHLSPQHDLEFPGPKSMNDSEGKSHRSTLLNLSLTCHAFTEVALDLLWRKIDKMSHLLRLLSAFKVVDKNNQRRYALDGPILDCEWALLDKYARRVRHLIYHPESDSVYRSAFLRVVQKTHKPFFPRLRELSIRRGYYSEVLLLVSSSLLRVHVKEEETYPHRVMQLFLDSMVKQAPNMQYLHFGSRDPERFLDSITKLKNLRHLGLSQVSTWPGETLNARVDSTFFAKLARMEHLSSVYCRGLADSRNELHQPAFVAFCSLTKLTVASTVQQVVPLLKSGSFYALESFTLVFTCIRKNLKLK
ncbi:hypothetical protein BDZ97DRAFT_2059926 [Flammula alnicola]|nr:hypothetical protein BDZ97DRAFT_2059926 [Flammula alnicola]